MHLNYWSHAGCTAVLFCFVPFADQGVALGGNERLTGLPGHVLNIAKVSVGGTNVVAQVEGVGAALSDGSVRALSVGHVGVSVLGGLDVSHAHLERASLAAQSPPLGLVFGGDVGVRGSTPADLLTSVDDASDQARFVRLNDSLTDALAAIIVGLAKVEALVVIHNWSRELCSTLIAANDTRSVLKGVRVGLIRDRVLSAVKDLLALIGAVLNSLYLSAQGGGGASNNGKEG